MEDKGQPPISFYVEVTPASGRPISLSHFGSIRYRLCFQMEATDLKNYTSPDRDFFGRDDSGDEAENEVRSGPAGAGGRGRGRGRGRGGGGGRGRGRGQGRGRGSTGINLDDVSDISSMKPKELVSCLFFKHLQSKRADHQRRSRKRKRVPSAALKNSTPLESLKNFDPDHYWESLTLNEYKRIAFMLQGTLGDEFDHGDSLQGRKAYHDKSHPLNPFNVFSFDMLSPDNYDIDQVFKLEGSYIDTTEYPLVGEYIFNYDLDDVCNTRKLIGSYFPHIVMGQMNAAQDDQFL